MENIEQISFSIISSAGDAQSKMFEALSSARSRNFSQADTLMKEAEILLANAHTFQTDLIKKEANGEKSGYSILLVHAQDHLMNGMLSKQLVKEMIHLYQELENKK